jgi:hypothetical protein
MRITINIANLEGIIVYYFAITLVGFVRILVFRVVVIRIVMSL